MRRPFLVASLVVCFLLSGLELVWAEELAAPEPPRLLRITRVVLKPGNLAEFQRLEAGRSKALLAANWLRVTLALASVTGRQEVWFLTFYDSLGDWGKDREEIDKMPSLKAELQRIDKEESDLVSSKVELRVSYHKDISYRTDYDWASMRYMDSINIHIHPGHHAEYLENRRITLGGHQKGKIDEHLFIYTVSGGTLSGTYFILRPVKSLLALEQMEDAHGKGGEILSEEEHKRMVEVFAASVETEEEQIFCADPQMSYVTPAWAGANSDFWRAHFK